MRKIKRVLIVLRLSGAAGRDILSGILLFTHQNPLWHTRIIQMPSDLTPELFKSLETDGCDGIIMSEPGPENTARLLRDSSVPIAFIGNPGPVLGQRKAGITYVRNDDTAIGRLAANYLASLGKRRAYGFVPTTSYQLWSEDRRKGFHEELARQGLAADVFQSPSSTGSAPDLAALKEWLIKLPKPAAVLAAWDVRATHVLQLCEDAKIRVPGQVAVLGVDNDELLDESTKPPLSSIQPDHEKLGFVAARELKALMAGRQGKADAVFLARPARLVERESATVATPAAHLVTRATDFIRKNAKHGITPDDVARFLGISRRLADLRFNQFNGETINATIVHYRLEAVKKLLATTNRPIKNISVACGYNDLAYLKTLFKRHFGMTMRDWRTANRA